MPEVLVDTTATENRDAGLVTLEAFLQNPSALDDLITPEFIRADGWTRTEVDKANPGLIWQPVIVFRPNGARNNASFAELPPENVAAPGVVMAALRRVNTGVVADENGAQVRLEQDGQAKRLCFRHSSSPG